jgi:hypothetical protein
MSHTSEGEDICRRHGCGHERARHEKERRLCHGYPLTCKCIEFVEVDEYTKGAIAALTVVLGIIRSRHDRGSFRWAGDLISDKLEKVRRDGLAP